MIFLKSFYLCNKLLIAQTLSQETQLSREIYREHLFRTSSLGLCQVYFAHLCAQALRIAGYVNEDLYY